MEQRFKSGYRACGLAIGVLLVLGGSASGHWFEFTISPAHSGLDGTLSLTSASSGSLVGNWDPAANPGGTRTKPGLFGSFGPAENVPVATSLTTSAAGPLSTSATGAFGFILDPGAGTAQINDYTSSLISGSPAALPVTLTLLYESFRTRAPDSSYPGGVPIPIPFGEASLTELSLVQIGGGAGTLVQTGSGRYEFTVAPIVQLSAAMMLMGMPVVIPGAPTVFPLQGEITVSGASAVLTSLRALEVSEQLQLNLALPQFAFELPTVLPPGGTAHLLMDQTLENVAFDLVGTTALHATGVLIPSPGVVWVLALGAVPLVQRRRDRRGRL